MTRQLRMIHAAALLLCLTSVRGYTGPAPQRRTTPSQQHYREGQGQDSSGGGGTSHRNRELTTAGASTLAEFNHPLRSRPSTSQQDQLRRHQPQRQRRVARTGGGDLPTEGESEDARTGWRRRVLNTVLLRRRSRSKINMSAVALEVAPGERAAAASRILGLLRLNKEQEISILSDFESKYAAAQAGALPVAPRGSLPRDLANQLAVEAAGKAAAATQADAEAPTSGGGSPLTRVTRNWAQNFLTGLLDNWSDGSHENMVVQCDPHSSLLEITRGKFRCDASVDFDRIDFGAIRMSGGRVEAHRLALNLYSFLNGGGSRADGEGAGDENNNNNNADFVDGDGNKRKKFARFPNRFDFLARDVVFTEEDLFESDCIRNGLRKLLTRILHGRGMTGSTVEIRSIRILPGGKISVRGGATTLFDSPVPFEVRSGISFKGRGHIVTFPGLEISVSPSSFDLFVPIKPTVSLDMGHNAQIHDVQIDGERRELRLSALATITPAHTIKLHKYTQSSDAYAAHFSVDVGRFLTNIGRFSA